MFKFVWSYIRNIFDIITLHNLRKMDSLSQDHDLKLYNNIGDTFIAGLYATFHPIRISFHEWYTKYKIAIASSQAATKTIEDLWAKLSSILLEDWDVAIRKVYRKDTDRYKQLFPQGHKPFYHGRYEERITFLEAFLGLLDGDAPLADVKTSVEAFITAYTTAFAAQVGKQNDVKNCSIKLRLLRKECAVAMYSNLGYLIGKNAATPEVVGGYFDLEQIRRSTPKADGGPGTEFTVVVSGGEAKEAGFAFADSTRFLFYNSGTTKMAVNTSPTSTQTELPDYAVVFEPEEEGEKLATDLGMAGYRYMIITNMEAASEGEMTIDTVE